MNFEQFREQARKAYHAFTFDECMMVFQDYFEQYEAFTGVKHPPLKTAEIAAIIAKMPCIDGLRTQDIALDAGDYHELIKQYFATPFPNSDRNIKHFFSGRIREYRFKELHYNAL